MRNRTGSLIEYFFRSARFELQEGHRPHCFCLPQSRRRVFKERQRLASHSTRELLSFSCFSKMTDHFVVLACRWLLCAPRSTVSSSPSNSRRMLLVRREATIHCFLDLNIVFSLTADVATNLSG